MRASARLVDSRFDTDTPEGSIVYSIRFEATDDPRSGQTSAVVDLSWSEETIKNALKQAVVDFINTSRAATVISLSEIVLL